MKALVYVEIDVDYCSLTYGVAPCSAALGVTGDRKCFNTLKTCQDREDFTNAPVTLRFSKDAGYNPPDIDVVASSIESVSFSPAIISLGENLGQRATLSVTFKDHRHSDTGPGFDKYWTERGYDPFKQGTFWAKFRARQPFLRGRNIRVIRGELGQTLDQMETRHFILESFEGPGPDGKYTLVAKDALKMADGDRAQAPKLSNGFLVAAITETATTATLSPAGIGNLEYPASGYATIGGKEVVYFTRSADVLSFPIPAGSLSPNGRGQLGTVAAKHDAQDRVQLCLRYVAMDPAAIIADLFTNYAGVPPEFIPLASWTNETQAYYRRLLTATIAEPTDVSALASEIIQQAALAIWWDDLAKLLRLQVLRQISTDAALFDRSNTLRGSLGIREQPDKRISQVWTFFGQNDPTKKRDDPDNYRSCAVTVDPQAETDYGTAAIKKIFARWIPQFGRQVALRTNDIQLGRFRDAPRRFTLGAFRTGGLIPTLGRGYLLQAQILQQDTGAPDTVPIQITRVNPGDAEIEVEAEEMRFISFDEDDLGNRTLIIDANVYNVNLRTAYDQLYPVPVSGDVVTIIVEPGVIVGSINNTLPGIHVGSWPTGVILNMTVRGRIQGKGGNGAVRQNGNSLPQAGGPALYTRFPINLLGDGQIWGGGGGGAARAYTVGDTTVYRDGGGGQGALPGSGSGTLSVNGKPGTTEAAGLGGNYTNINDRAGDGGAAGQPGTAPGSAVSPPGAGGAGIDGNSFVTVVNSADIRGARIN